MTLPELKRLLLAEVRNEAALAFINTRLILRTGVNLNQSDSEVEPRRIDNAVLEIRAMGFLKERER